MIEQQDRAGSRHGVPAPAVRLAIALLAAAWMVAGCGQKGPLYLPEEAQPGEQAAETTAPGTPAEEPSDEVDDAATDTD